VLSTLLVLLSAGVAVWLLTPPRIDQRILPGMTRAKVEEITGQKPHLSMLWASVNEERYSSPDGDLIVKYVPAELFGSEKDIVVDRRLLQPKSFLERIRDMLGW
jgi:hypothetical protein